MHSRIPASRATWDPPTTGITTFQLCQSPAQNQTHTMTGYPPISHAARSKTTRIPTPWPRQTPARSRSHGLLGCPDPQPTTVQALLSPSYVWNDQTSTPQTPPAHQAQMGCSSLWNDWSPAPLGYAPAWQETAKSTSPPGTPLIRQSQPQL
jgi:hypothetical protein